MIVAERGGLRTGIWLRKADRSGKGSLERRRGGRSRATSLPLSVMMISRPFRTSSRRAERFCRASRIPAFLMSEIVLRVAPSVKPGLHERSPSVQFGVVHRYSSTASVHGLGGDPATAV